ncbi:MAG: 6-carboxytetrahydropterin synthase [Lentisphaeraceae bacterium]|nr:6-carboxytetrahydropterin synthase [Lentisphaeraceae bacterium]
MFRSTKSFYYLPCAHRQWRDDGHCSYVHGYDRSVHLEFQCKELDDKMWVMDFGGLKQIKAWLENLFDHTLLINEDDPEMAFFEEMDRKGLCQLRVMPNIGMEGSAQYIFEYIDNWLNEQTNGRVQLYSVECKENEKNSAIYFRDDVAGLA